MVEFKKLTDDQLSGLASLCFDLAKGALGVALIPATTAPLNPLVSIFQTTASIITGLAFIYMALLLLERKEHV